MSKAVIGIGYYVPLSRISKSLCNIFLTFISRYSLLFFFFLIPLLSSFSTTLLILPSLLPLSPHTTTALTYSFGKSARSWKKALKKRKSCWQTREWCTAPLPEASPPPSVSPSALRCGPPGRMPRPGPREWLTDGTSGYMQGGTTQAVWMRTEGRVC